MWIFFLSKAVKKLQPTHQLSNATFRQAHCRTRSFLFASSSREEWELCGCTHPSCGNGTEIVLFWDSYQLCHTTNGTRNKSRTIKSDKQLCSSPCMPSLFEEVAVVPDIPVHSEHIQFSFNSPAHNLKCFTQSRRTWQSNMVWFHCFNTESNQDGKNDTEILLMSTLIMLWHRPGATNWQTAVQDRTQKSSCTDPDLLSSINYKGISNPMSYF